MAKDNFWKQASKALNRTVNNNELKLSDDSLIFINKQESEEKVEEQKKIQVFNNYFQTKSWNGKHLELLDEYRRMDNTFPIISAALKIYSQEACLTGDIKIDTPMGKMRIDEAYKKELKDFYVKVIDYKNHRVQYGSCKEVVCKGFKKVYKIELVSIGKEVKEFKCTEDHLIMTNNGSFKQLKELGIGDYVGTMDYTVDPSCSCLIPNITNTQIVNITELEQEELVYDLLDVIPDNHFMIQVSKDSYVTVHNCCKDTDGNIFKINSDNEKLKNELEDLFFKNLRMNSMSYRIVKSYLKFGNHYAFAQTRRGYGVVDLVHLPPESLKIELNKKDLFDLGNFNYRGQGIMGSIEFEPWEIVHWKFMDDIETEPYGQSILRSIVDTYRRIVMMRDALIIYRITRAPQRLLFKLDSGNLDPDAAQLQADEIKKSLYKKPLVNPQTGEMDYKYSPTPVAVYTPIPLLDGRTLTISELIQEYEEGKKNFVYSLKDNTKEVVAGEIAWAGVNYNTNKIYRIWLDNGTYIDSADEHPFMLRDGSKLRADELNVGDSLMPSYIEYEEVRPGSKSSYEKIYNPSTEKFEFTHRLISKEIPKAKEKYTTIHHKDFNRYNNSPENLEWVDFHEHRTMHGEMNRKRESWKPMYEALNNNPILREKQKKAASITGKRRWKNRREELIKNMTIQINNKIFKIIYDFIKEDTLIDEVLFFINSELSSDIKKLNPKISNVKITGTIFERILKDYNYNGIKEIKCKKFNLTNNEVISLVSKKAFNKFKQNESKYKSFIDKTIENNIRFNKSEKLKEGFINKLQNGELNFSGENNGNFKGFPNKEELLKILELKKWNNLLEFKEQYLISFPTKKRNFTFNDISKIINKPIEEIVSNYFYYANGFNHTISKIEILDLNTDVACMTIVGPNNSNDRHNFLTSGIKEDGTIEKHNIFIFNSIQENIYMSTSEGDQSDVRVLEGACLKGDTLIRTSLGIMPIRELAEHFDSETKKVYSLSVNIFDKEITGKILWCKVTNNVNQLYKITYSGLEGKTYTTEATDNHPFMVKDLTYVRADELVIGQELKGTGFETYIIKNIELIDYPNGIDVYDLEVEEYHNFALESGIFVHNSNLDQVEDYKIIKDDLFAGLMIPKQYLQFEEVQTAKAALVQEDIRFANLIKQIQEFFVEGLLHISLIHLHLKGYSKEEMEDFTIEMNTNSTFAERTRKELLEQRFAIAQMAWDASNEGLNFMSFTQVLKDILKFSDTQIKRIIEDQFIEKKLAWRLINLSQNGMFEETQKDVEEREAKEKEKLSVFKNLKFESIEDKTQNESIKGLLTQQLDEELKHLIRPIVLKPTSKQVLMLKENYQFNNSVREEVYKIKQDLRD